LYQNNTAIKAIGQVDYIHKKTIFIYFEILTMYEKSFESIYNFNYTLY